MILGCPLIQSFRPTSRGSKPGSCFQNLCIHQAPLAFSQQGRRLVWSELLGRSRPNMQSGRLLPRADRDQRKHRHHLGSRSFHQISVHTLLCQWIEQRWNEQDKMEFQICRRRDHIRYRARVTCVRNACYVSNLEEDLCYGDAINY